MSVGALSPRRDSAELVCGALAGPLFVAVFTVLGAARRGYEWRRYPVSSLAVGRHGWWQRANFIATGLLYWWAARGVKGCERVEPRVVPALVATTGIGLVGSGLFATDYVGDLVRDGADENSCEAAISAPTGSTFAGRMHDLCGLPVFVGIPIAGFVSAGNAVSKGDHLWAAYSAGSSAAMSGGVLALRAAMRGHTRLRGKSGMVQRISIVAGFGWLTALSLRCLSAAKVDH
ncbi:DUF998 domain-containing protein [Mycobacterium sp. Marseille-P9652]|uniref:DUF998 domain-containing protein n=1 Tax=Mycobacterium sp. Marseille-P9652 TaxID=2654950 RepID=UPI0012E8E031|nr:DUF998 domain-containing protein [Mycobacterium sp. Marseille-P9652]